jgi:hypothetical protein
MKKVTLKILAAIGAFIGIVMLIFKGSSSSSETKKAIEDNNNKLDKIKDSIIEVAKDKEQTKRHIKIASDRIKNTVNKKKSTKSAVKKAKDFKDKYKK